MFYEGQQFWGMHLIRWVIWMILLFWIFATPYSIPGQRAKKASPLDVLKMRFATGEIDSSEFEERKNILEKSELNPTK